MGKFEETKTVSQRFWEKVSPGSNGCYEWKASKDQCGYGLFWFEKRMAKAHRVSYLLNKGDIPQGIQVLHKCDNPGCVNPKHLFLGTHQENMMDKVRKGRQSHAGKGSGGPKPWSSRPGEKNPNSKLTRDQIKKIKKDYASGKITQKELGAMYGVSQATIHKIVNGLRWTHI